MNLQKTLHSSPKKMPWDIEIGHCIPGKIDQYYSCWCHEEFLNRNHFEIGHCITGDPLHNLTEIHTTLQHTTELHTTQRHGGVLARLCAICPGGNVGWPNVGPTSVLSSRRWANVSPTNIAVWLVSLWRVTRWRTQPSQHTTERQGCVQLGGVLLGCV